MDTATRPPTSESSASTAPTAPIPLRNMTSERQAAVMQRLWDRMSAVYGADRWERAYGAQWSEEWLRTLAGRTVEDIARGLDRCRADDSGRLPTLGQFAHFTRPVAAYQEHRPLPSVASLAQRSAAGRKWLAFMWYEEIVPRPANVTMDVLDELLIDADIGAMREQVEQGKRAIAKRFGVNA